MQTEYTKLQKRCMMAMVWLGPIFMVVALVLRVLAMPLIRDTDTGRFITDWGVVLFMTAALVVLAVPALLLRVAPPAMGRRGTMLLSLTTIGAGGVLALSCLWDVWMLLSKGQQPLPSTAMTGAVGVVTMWLMLLCGLLGGVALVLWGRRLAAQGATCNGMGPAVMLAPVLWMWLRLARYEMSYASAVGLSETFYDVLLFVFLLLFLYKLARYVVGVDTPCIGSLLFFAQGTVLFALSGTLTRACMYLAGDSEAYLASRLAGWPDFALGLLALVFGGVLVYRAMTASAKHHIVDVSSVEDELVAPEEGEASEETVPCETEASEEESSVEDDVVAGGSEEGSQQ